MDVLGRYLALVKDTAERIDFLRGQGFVDTALEAPPSLRTVHDAVAACTRCPLAAADRAGGRGAEGAALMIVGPAARAVDGGGTSRLGAEAEGLLDRIVASMGLDGKALYVTSSVKCPPPDGRRAEEAEISSCRVHVEEEVRAVRPAMVLLMGDEAAALVGSSVGELRGEVRLLAGVPAVATHDPETLLARKELKKETWSDVQAVMAALGLRGR
ncbi:MAG TPA: hypothetical protein ENJ37_03070 [Deltaproteobacteria bacterium]|nr:hypothetical protein [Deltaproteobacteria bacterium]